MKSHEGLRGLCCLWVLLFHCVEFTSKRTLIHLNGSVAMTVFFLLSGFSLGAVHGPKENMDKLKFYRKRFLRTYPVHFITTFACLGLIFTDFGWFPGNPWAYVTPFQWATQVFLNFSLINQWVMCVTNLHYYALNGPSWFLSVLWFQYIVFPFTLPLLKRVKERISWILCLYVIQATLSSFIYLTTRWFHVATMNIITPAFFIFHIGVLLGLWMHDLVTEEKETITSNNEKSSDKTAKMWAPVTDATTFVYFFLLISCTIIDSRGYKCKADFWFQIFGVPMPALIIVSLTLDRGKSIFARLCLSKALKGVSRIGMSVYLVQEPLIRYTCVFLQKISPKAFEKSFPEESVTMPGGNMPFWGIFIVMPLALVIGAALERYVARPCLETEKYSSRLLCGRKEMEKL